MERMAPFIGPLGGTQLPPTEPPKRLEPPADKPAPSARQQSPGGA